MAVWARPLVTLPLQSLPAPAQRPTLRHAPACPRARRPLFGAHSLATLRCRRQQSRGPGASANGQCRLHGGEVLVSPISAAACLKKRRLKMRPAGADAAAAQYVCVGAGSGAHPTPATVYKPCGLTQPTGQTCPRMRGRTTPVPREISEHDGSKLLAACRSGAHAKGNQRGRTAYPKKQATARRMHPMASALEIHETVARRERTLRESRTIRS